MEFEDPGEIGTDAKAVTEDPRQDDDLVLEMTFVTGEVTVHEIKRRQLDLGSTYISVTKEDPTGRLAYYWPLHSVVRILVAEATK